MQQWYTYFDNVIANERAAVAEQLHKLRAVMIDAAGEALAEVRREIEQQHRCALDLALAEVRKGVVSLQKEHVKQRAVTEKLLPEIALLKKQVAMLSDAHNKSLQNSITHLGHRMTAMESVQHVTDRNAIADLEKRLNAAAEFAATLPSWMARGPQF